MPIRGILRVMVVLKAFIVALIAAAVAVALIPLMVLLDLRRGGTGWGLCSDGLSGCRSSYFDGFEFKAWLYLALLVLFGMTALCVRILRFLQSRAADNSPVTYQ